MKKIVFIACALFLVGCAIVELDEKIDSNIGSVTFVDNQASVKENLDIHKFTLSNDKSLSGLSIQRVGEDSEDMPLLIQPKNISKLKMDLQAKLRFPSGGVAMPSVVDILSGYISSTFSVDGKTYVSIRNGSQSFTFTEEDTKKLIQLLSEIESDNGA